MQPPFARRPWELTEAKVYKWGEYTEGLLGDIDTYMAVERKSATGGSFKPVPVALFENVWETAMT